MENLVRVQNTDKRMKIAALIIAYNPDRELLRRNIEAFIDYVDAVFIWRNSPDTIDYLSEWKDKIHFCGDGGNQYLAKPINEIIELCSRKGFDFLLTMDQDSCWENFEGFISTVQRTQEEGEVGIYAPNVNNYLKNPDIEYKDIEWVIQSGMLIDLKVINGLGGFREDYEMYGIDEEFCYWLHKNGKKVRSYTNFHLKQRYGNQQKSRFGFDVYNYSPDVRYHLIRNMIWMKREFPKSTITRRILHVIFDNYRDIILVERNKLAKLKAFTLGICHGCFMKFDRR